MDMNELTDKELLQIAEEVRAQYSDGHAHTVLVADLPDKFSYHWKYPNEPAKYKTWPKY